MQLSPVKAVYTGVHRLAQIASRNYIAGPTLSDAMAVARPLAERGYSITLGYWDAEDDSASHVLESYVASCEALSQLGSGAYLSIKIPALRHDDRLFRVLQQKSRDCGVPLNFDSIDTANASSMFQFIADHRDPSAGDLGCVLPGRWRRSLDDADRAIDLGLIVRVVKGQSPDPAEPDRDPSAGYLSVVQRLAGRARCVRVASHDPVVMREALTILTTASTPCEVEFLYGLPVRSQVAIAREFKVPIRVYVAFGHAFLPYAMASLRKRPGTLFRLLREAVRGDCLATFSDVRGGAVLNSPR